MNGALTGAFFAEVAIISARDLVQEKRPPYPSEFLASFVVFGAFSVLAVASPGAAAAAGWGIVVATLVASQVDWLGPVGDFLSGKNATPAAKPATTAAG